VVAIGRPCGHGELPPLEAYAGVSVRVSGIPAAQHAAFEGKLDDRTARDGNVVVRPGGRSPGERAERRRRVGRVMR
jgi:hypothetical protein